MTASTGSDRRGICDHEVTRVICACPWYDARCHECGDTDAMPPCLVGDPWLAQLEESEAAILRGDLGEPMSVDELRRQIRGES